MLLNHQQTLPSPSLTNPTSGSCPPQAGKSKTAFKGHLTPSTWVCTVPEGSEDPKYRKMLNRGAFCRFEKRRCREIKSMLLVSESVWFSVELYIKTQSLRPQCYFRCSSCGSAPLVWSPAVWTHCSFSDLAVDEPQKLAADQQQLIAGVRGNIRMPFLRHCDSCNSAQY